LNNAVAKLLLEEELGLQVETVPADVSTQWDRIAAGELHASLEIWPSGRAKEMGEHLGKGVEDAGQLGAIAKVGWFVPSYMVTSHPELAAWTGFRTSDAARLFATPATNGAGRFVGGDPAWGQHDQEIIDNLKLDFDVVFAGSEDAELAEVEEAYRNHRPILFFFWLPHWAFVKYQLTMVELPPYSDRCWSRASTGGIDCDYPTERLFKIVWPALASYSPRAYSFIKKMSYSTKDQIDLMAAVSLRGLSVEGAAREWIAANRAVWSAWTASGD
jgi:glycine betaine/proline transport system substrate-binding protein